MHIDQLNMHKIVINTYFNSLSIMEKNLNKPHTHSTDDLF